MIEPRVTGPIGNPVYQSRNPQYDRQNPWSLRNAILFGSQAYGYYTAGDAIINSIPGAKRLREQIKKTVKQKVKNQAGFYTDYYTNDAMNYDTRKYIFGKEYAKMWKRDKIERDNYWKGWEEAKKKGTLYDYNQKNRYPAQFYQDLSNITVGKVTKKGSGSIPVNNGNNFSINRSNLPTKNFKNKIFKKKKMARYKRKFKKFKKTFTRSNKKKGKISMKKYLKNTLSERHYVDVRAEFYCIDTPQFLLLNGLKRGSGMFNRTGSKFSNLWLELKYDIWNNEETTTSAKESSQRIAIFWDKKPAGAPPGGNDVFYSWNNVGQTLIGRNPTMDGISPANLNRFKLLYDICIDLPAFKYIGGTTPEYGVSKNIASYVVNPQREHRIFIPLKGVMTGCKLDSDTGNIDDIMENALFACTYNDNIGVTDGAFKIEIQARLCFYP